MVSFLSVVIPSGLTAVLCWRWSAAVAAVGVPCPMYRAMSAGFLGGLTYWLDVIMEMREQLASGSSAHTDTNPPSPPHSSICKPVSPHGEPETVTFNVFEDTKNT
jgi:hypothetical protein